MSSLTVTATARFFVFFFLSFAIAAATSGSGNVTTGTFPAVFCFGDSIADTGNNNFIKTTFKGNFYPYGVDYYYPSGRFSNGPVVCDILAQYISLKPAVPPYLQRNLSKSDILTGVCFASAGSGYDPATSNFSNVIPMSQQLMYFEEYIEILGGLVGKPQAGAMLKDALFAIIAGTNDLLIGYPQREAEYKIMNKTVGDYQDFLLQLLTEFLTELHGMGARKFIVTGIPPLGFTPYGQNTVVLYGSPQQQNENAQSYNRKLSGTVLPDLQRNLTDSKIAYADAYNAIYEILAYQIAYGFTEIDKGCCGTGELEIGFFCGIAAISNLCPNRSTYFWFDAIHPTGSAYNATIQKIGPQVLPQLT